MKALVKKMRSFLRTEDGPTAVEYAVMLALIVFGCFTTIVLIGNKVEAAFTTLESGLPSGS